MLSPQLLDTEDDLVASANLFWRITGFTSSLKAVTVGKLSPQPGWLDSVTAAFGRSRGVAAKWEESKPDIVAPIVTAYVTYHGAFKSVTETIPRSADKGTWVSVLGDLKTRLESNGKILLGVELKMDNLRGDLVGVHDELKRALQIAEDAHEKDHEVLTNLKLGIAALTSRFSELSGDATSTDLDAGKTMCSTVASVAIPIFMATGEAIPFLSIAFSVLSVGKSLYTLIATDREIEAVLTKLYGDMRKASQEIQALAATHALLQLLETLDEKNHKAIEKMPKLKTMWRDEAEKVGEVINSLESGSDPQHLLALTALPPALAVWQTLAKAATNILTNPVGSGGTVEFSPKDGQLRIA